MRERSGKKSCHLLIGKRSCQDGRTNHRQSRLKLCSRLLALDQERARRAAVVLLENVVNEVGRECNQIIDEEESCGQDTNRS